MWGGCQGHFTKSTSLYVGPVPVWGAALALAIWWSGVRCPRGMETLLKVMVRIGVSPVTFLSLHLSAFWSSVHSAAATKVVGECWHLKNEEPDRFWCSAFKLIFIFRCPVLKDLVQDCSSIVLWNYNWTVGFSFPEAVSPLRGWL